MNTLTKILLVVMLLAGAGLGYGIDFMITDPVMKGLEADLNTTSNELANTKSELQELQINYQALETNFSWIRDEFNELKNNSVDKDDYDELLAEHHKVLSDLSNTELLLDETNQSYQTLSDMYLELLIDYNLRVLPESLSMIVNNLNITITLNGTRFEHNKPLTGTVSINYLKGEPFLGKISFWIRNEFFELSTQTDEQDIFGESKFSIYGKFIWGAGRYSIALKEIVDVYGETVATHSDLRDYRLYFEVL
jgi:hypothetical protein